MTSRSDANLVMRLRTFVSMAAVFHSVKEPETEARLRGLVGAGVAAAILLTGLLGALSWSIALQAARDADSVAHAHQVSATLEHTLRHLIDVETGARGFALTGHEPFLEPYNAGRYTVILDLQALQKLLVDPDQAPRLDQLVNQAKSCLEATANLVAARRQSAETPSLALITRGKQAMDAVRSTVQQMEDQEKRLLAQRVQRVRATRRYTSAAIGLGSILTIVFLSVAGLIVSREIRVAAKAQAQVRALNADLEERVEQRTAALRESETKLTVSEQLLRSLLDGVVDYAIYMLDAEGRVVSWNSGAARINGYQAEEIIGKHVSCFYTAIDLERNRPAAALHEAATTGKFEEQGVRVRKDGSNFWADVVITPLHDANGDLTGYSKVVRDITARKQAEEVRELLAAIVDFSDDAIISKTLDGTIAAWNRGAENVFGYSAAEIVGKPIQLLLPPDRAHEESDILARITRGESVDHFETVRVRKDGTNIDVSVTISPIRDSDGVIVGASKIARDITGRKQAEDALREKERRLSESQRIAHVGSWSYDLTVPEARIAWSDELYRLYGVPPDTEGFGRPGASLVWHQHRHQRAQKDRGATGAASGAIAPFPRVAGNSDVHASECDE